MEVKLLAEYEGRGKSAKQFVLEICKFYGHLILGDYFTWETFNPKDVPTHVGTAIGHIIEQTTYKTLNIIKENNNGNLTLIMENKIWETLQKFGEEKYTNVLKETKDKSDVAYKSCKLAISTAKIADELMTNCLKEEKFLLSPEDYVECIQNLLTFEEKGFSELMMVTTILLGHFFLFTRRLILLAKESDQDQKIDQEIWSKLESQHTRLMKRTRVFSSYRLLFAPTLQSSQLLNHLICLPNELIEIIASYCTLSLLSADDENIITDRLLSLEEFIF